MNETAQIVEKWLQNRHDAITVRRLHFNVLMTYAKSGFERLSKLPLVSQRRCSRCLAAALLSSSLSSLFSFSRSLAVAVFAWSRRGRYSCCFRSRCSVSLPPRSLSRYPRLRYLREGACKSGLQSRKVSAAGSLARCRRRVAVAVALFLR